MDLGRGPTAPRPREPLHRPHQPRPGLGPPLALSVAPNSADPQTPVEVVAGHHIATFLPPSTSQSAGGTQGHFFSLLWNFPDLSEIFLERCGKLFVFKFCNNGSKSMRAQKDLSKHLVPFWTVKSLARGHPATWGVWPRPLLGQKTDRKHIGLTLSCGLPTKPSLTNVSHLQGCL